MNKFNNLIVGSGISALVVYKNSSRKPQIFTSDKDQILRSKNFYEYDFFGGNTNIWGGYINLKRHNKFLKSGKYKKLFNKKIFLVRKIFHEHSKFSNTQCLFNSKNEIFRVDNSFFDKKLIKKKINRIILNKKNIEIVTESNSVFTNQLSLCIGNLSLIKLLYDSGWVDRNDVISFDDGNCGYVLNFLINQKSNYYIPMPLVEIIEKLLFKKSKTYKVINNSFILQKFSNSVKKHEINCEELLKMNSSKIRYYLSNHIANLRVNNIPIRKFIKHKSKKINVFCSGTVKKYLPGPIIQDLIFDIIINQ